MKLLRNTHNLTAAKRMYSDHATAVFDCLGKQASAMGSAQQRLNTCALTKEAIAKKKGGIEENAGCGRQQRAARTLLARDISRTRRAMLGRMAVMIVAWSRSPAPTAGHYMWSPFGHSEASQLTSTSRQTRKPANRRARSRQASMGSPSESPGAGFAGARDFRRVGPAVGSAVLAAGTPRDSGTARRKASDWPICHNRYRRLMPSLDPRRILDNQPVGVQLPAAGVALEKKLHPALQAPRRHRSSALRTRCAIPPRFRV